MGGKDFEWNPEDPLGQCPGELHKANVALWDYALMGPGRSLAKLARLYSKDAPDFYFVPTRHLRTLKVWSSRYRWQDRIAAWARMGTEHDEELWRKRQHQLRELEWGQSQRLFERAKQMLQYPLSQVVKEEGAENKVQIIAPAGWSLRDVARFLETASKLGRLSAEMQTERIEIDWREMARRDGLSPSEVEEFYKRMVAQLTELLAQEEGE